jgi:hypothetical protein
MADANAAIIVAVIVVFIAAISLAVYTVYNCVTEKNIADTPQKRFTIESTDEEELVIFSVEDKSV